MVSITTSSQVRIDPLPADFAAPSTEPKAHATPSDPTKSKRKTISIVIPEDSEELTEFSKKMKIPSVSAATCKLILQLLQEQGYEYQKTLATDINKVFKVTKEDKPFLLKVTPLTNRDNFFSKIDPEHGESLIQSLPPHERINAILQRCFFAKGKLLSNKTDESECLIEISPFVEGDDVCDLIMEKGAFSREKAIKYAVEVGEAIRFLHDHGIAYRDLKPQNLILDTNDHIRLVDMEFAKRNRDEPFTPLGTPQYLPPELSNVGLRQDPKLLDRLDSFAFGVTLFMFVTGFPPYTDQQRIEFYRTGKPTPFMNSKYVKDPYLLSLIEKLMTREPENRISVKEATEILKKMQEDIPIPPTIKH